MSFRVVSERLVVRPWRSQDRNALRALATDPQVMRHISDGVPWSEAQIDEMLERQSRHLAEHQVCMGALELRDRGDVIGLAGLQPLGTTGRFEVGWWLLPEHWKKGLATEAGSALVRFGLVERGLPEVVAIARPENEASLRVMERIGMRFDRLVLGEELGLVRAREITLALYSIAGGVATP